MKKICTFLTASTLCLAAINAQTISDDFNDNSRDPAIWLPPSLIDGAGDLLEQNEHVEFTTTGVGETEVGQSLFKFDTNDQAEWRVQMVASMSTSNFSEVGEVGTVSIGIGTGDHYLELGYGAGILAEGVPLGTALAAEWTGGVGEADKITIMALPPAVGIRFTYDPQLHLIRTYYNLSADITAGEWILYESFTIDGSTVAGAVVLNWGMAPNDTFYFAIQGWSSGAAIAAGSAWADDFTFHVGPDLTGYDLWASAIPEAGMRGTTVDASGNGIPNLLQYVYGLDPMATDTDVKLKIQMEGGLPVIYHGLNETATDYHIGYQFKNSLTDSWMSAVGDEATSMVPVQVNGKTLRKLTFPMGLINNFMQVEILP